MNFKDKILNILAGIYGILPFSRQVSVLAYHSVSDGTTPISLSVEEFKEQMEYFHTHGFHVIDLHTYMEIQKGHRKAQPKSILITFDDAYKDVYQNALPILKKYKFPAVMSVNPFYFGKKAEFATRDVDRMRDICTVEELKELASNGVTIVNHGFSHKDMTTLSEEKTRYEYEEAKNWIDTNIEKNKCAEVFVFPKGIKNDRSVSMLQSLGAKTIFNKRINVYPNISLSHFILSLRPSFQWLRENKKFLFGVLIIVVLKIILGILLLHNIPNLSLPKDLFIPTGGDDYSYVASAKNILSGRWFSSIDIIGYPPFIALVSLISSQTSLPGLALPLFIANIFLFSIGVSVLTMFIIKKIWHKNSYAFLGGLFTVAFPYIWYGLMGNFTLVTYGGAIDHIGMSRSLQLFGLTVGSDWLGAFLVCIALLLLFKKKYGWAGLFFGLSFLVRTQNVFFLVFIPVALLILKKIRPAITFGIAGFIGGVLQLLSNVFLTGSPFIFAAYSAKYNPYMAVDGPRFSSFLNLPMAVYRQLAPTKFAIVMIVVCVLVMGIFFALKYFWKQKETFYFLLISGVIVPLSLFGISATIRNPRYFLGFIPIFLIFIIANYEVFFLKKKSYNQGQ